MLRKLFWLLCGIVILLQTVAALLAHYRIVDGDTSSTLVVIALIAEGPMILLSWILSRRKTRERRARYKRAYPTPEAVLQVLDGAFLRDARNNKGSAHAVRMLRKQFPEIPLDEAAKLVSSR
ncbi:hypothetical protein [Streptomyces sp. NPDC048650]|uniref:hypothetical protein n=1 Tax=unclassified Streptomyces TaxID=2593676 RepID=UPI003710C354